ncbi:MAG: DUF6252 family protein [Bacteroidota bacterium]
MKFLSLKAVMIALIPICLMVGSCSEDGTTINGTMKCKIDGTTWEAVLPSASILNGLINVTGISSNGMILTITVSGTTTGTYTLEPTGLNAIAFVENNSGTTPAFVSNQNIANTNYGEVVITNIDTDAKTISGTFFTEVHRLVDGMERIITEGEFNAVSYEDTTTPTNSTMSVTIDGNAWTANSASGFLNFGSLSLTGTDASGAVSVGLIIPDDTPPGMYTLGAPSFSTYGAQYNPGPNTFLAGDSGTLTITEHNTTTQVIKGNFEFDASEFPTGPLTATLTNGSFEISY